MTLDKHIEVQIQETKTAIKVLCELYPRAGGWNEPKCAGVVLRRLQLRNSNLLGFLKIGKD